MSSPRLLSVADKGRRDLVRANCPSPWIGGQGSTRASLSFKQSMSALFIVNCPESPFQSLREALDGTGLKTEMKAECHGPSVMTLDPEVMGVRASPHDFGATRTGKDCARRGHNLIPHLGSGIIPEMLALTGQTNTNLLRNRHIVIVIDPLIRRLVTSRAV